LKSKKKITIIPNVENKVFQENRESFLDYISEKRSVYSKYRRFFSQLDKQFARAEEAFENYQLTSNMPRQINVLNQRLL
jgi:transcription-repair coupling factor (superfamily II helicase)